ncbi:MAG: Uncharacterised protein [Marine Group II euryarchaeote MED-G33]|nr:MAG: Uncharacterised protein [Marine Group II euryarchaeote MED-G33]
MANPRAGVLGVTFGMLALASFILISNEENVSANAWALLALSGVFAAATVMVFFQGDGDLDQQDGANSVQKTSTQETQAQVLPDPSDDGFDVPIV